MDKKKIDIGGGIRLAYIDEGQGRPILFIHGFTGTAGADHGELIAHFQPTHRVIAPDLRGYGASRPPNRDFPPDFYQRDAADMAAFLDALAPGPVAVLGFSDGAEVSLLLAAARPDLVAGVVAWGVCGVIADEEIASIASWLPVAAWGPERQTWKQQIIKRHGAEQLEPMIAGWVAAAHAIHACGGNVSRDTADRIACPVLLMNGDGEIGNPPRDVRILAGRIPNGRLEFIAGSGHAIQRDQPQLLLERLQSFLNDLRW
jgi:valacyclovir hydrolase